MKKALVMLLVTGSMRSPVVHTQAPLAPGREPEFVEDELIIQYREDATPADKANARARINASPKAVIRRSGSGDLELASIPGRSVENAIALLHRHPAVRFAEPNWIVTHQADANDSLYTTGLLWGMYGDDLPSSSGPLNTTNEFGSQAEKAWAAGRIGSRNVYVGIIDQGIDLSHPDLVANIWTNSFDPADGVDNDGNGYIDDIHGWDFYENNNTIFDGAPGSTVDQHGTHVAGTIAATGNNDAGVAGVNWQVSLISAKFIGPAGGNVFWAIQALDYFIDLKTRHGLNIVATNNSWNGGGFSQALLDAIARAANAGILFVAAAGNGDIFGNPFNNDVTSRFPSNYNTESMSGYDAVIAVTALTSSGDKASWANYGATTVDLAAPGNAIYSTTPNGTYSSFSGTSMATPHVTGAVALYAAQNPGATAAQIREAILGSTTPTPSVDGITATNGRLNIGTLMAAPTSEPDPPAPPDGLVATAVAHNQIKLTWVDQSTDPAEEDGFEIDRCQGAGCTSFTQIAVVGANVTTYFNIDVAGSTTYRYRVRAFNAVGDSTDSNVADATTPSAPGPPAAPDGLVATAAAHDRINLTWADRSTDPAENGFEIDRCQGSSCTSFMQIAVVGANVTSYASTGLAANTTYRYRVRATNALGDSANSNAAEATTQAITSPPAAPSGLTATSGPAARQITLNWQDNATTESGFRIERCQNTGCNEFSTIAVVGANVTTFSDTGRKSRRTYQYRVRAYNGSGNSTYSNIASAWVP